MAAVMNYHKWGSLKPQKFISSQFWGEKSEATAWAGSLSHRRLEGGFSCPSPTSCGSGRSSAFGHLRPVSACIPHVSVLCVPFIRTLVVGFRAHLEKPESLVISAKTFVPPNKFTSIGSGDQDASMSFLQGCGVPFNP